MVTRRRLVELEPKIDVDRALGVRVDHVLFEVVVEVRVRALGRPAPHEALGKKGTEEADSVQVYGGERGYVFEL